MHSKTGCCYLQAWIQLLSATEVCPPPMLDLFGAAKDSYQKMLKATCWNLEAAAQIRCMDFFASANDWITAMHQQDQRRRSGMFPKKDPCLVDNSSSSWLTTADFQSISKISQKIQSQACRARGTSINDTSGVWYYLGFNHLPASIAVNAGTSKEKKTTGVTNVDQVHVRNLFPCVWTWPLETQLATRILLELRAEVSATGTSNARWSSQLVEQMGSPPAAMHHDAMWHSGTSVPHKHTRLGATACDPGDAHQGRPSDNPAPASQSRGTQHRRLRVHSQQCRSYRWSAEILPATDEQSVLIHAYWGMGLHAQHPAVYGLCIRFHDSCAEPKELIQWVLELTRLEPLLLARKISSVRVLVSSSRSHFLLLIAMLLLLLLCRLSLLCSLPLIHSIALFINSKPVIYCLSLTLTHSPNVCQCFLIQLI